MILLRAVPIALLAAIGGAATLAPTAVAALPWTSCDPVGFECVRLTVPLDRSQRVAGTIDLAVTRRPALRAGAVVAVVALAGGPGQAALPLRSIFASDLGSALATRDLLVYDQRGTGRSGPLDCPALSSPSGTLTQATRRCSLQLGRPRAFFRTADTVGDLEALRVAGGYDKLALYGVSYGTKVALAYAAAHPDRTEALVLDSVVTPEGPDAFRRSSLRAVPRVLGELCAAGRCRGVTSSVRRDVVRLASRLRKAPLKGTVYSATGRRATARLREEGLFGILLAGDLNPTLRAELPGSVRAALAGDAQPILRLSARSAGLENRAGYQASAADSDALFLATTCEENPTFPWTRGASQTRRAAQGTAAARRLSSRAVFPFSRTTALRQGILPLCLGWITASPSPAPAPPLAPLPILAIDGRGDLRTPLEDAADVARRSPAGQVLAVPNVGHSVLGSDPTSCSRDAIDAFFAGQAVTACPAGAPRFGVTPRPPRTAARLSPYATLRGRVGRTVEALRLTVNDAQAQLLGEALALGRAPRGAGGLRAGSVRVTDRGFSLQRYEYVPGVVITGTLRPTGTSTLRVTGSQASGGVVSVTQSLGVSGRLGGQRVSTRFGGQAQTRLRPYAGITVAQAAARGREIRARAAGTLAR